MGYATTTQISTETVARKAADTKEANARTVAVNSLDARLKVIEPRIADLLARVAALEKPIPAPPPGPVVPPPPPPVRPFPAPVTTQTVNVPTTIDATGATDAAAALQSFIDGVPDGSVIVFPSGGVYKVSVGIRVDNRNNLIFDLNGSTIRSTGSGGATLASPFVSGWGLPSNDIWVRNGVLEGNNPRTGTDIYDPSQESQHGVALNGGIRIEVSGCTIRRTWSDGIYLNQNTSGGVAWPTDVWLHDNALDYIGRNAFTANSSRRALIERNTVNHVGGGLLDIEPDTNSEGLESLILRDNIIDIYGMNPDFTQHLISASNNNYGPLAMISGLTITGNRVIGGAPSSINTLNAGGLSTVISRTARVSNVTFTNNTTTKAGAGPVLEFLHVDGLTVTGNTQPLVSGSLVLVSDCTNVVTSP